MITAILFTLGLLLLFFGGDFLVKGASRLAEGFGISKIVVGLTVVAFGTSMPELVVSVQAGLDLKPDIATGNVIGSNIFNILFILGLSALIHPLTVHKKLIRQEVPLMIFAAALMWFLSRDLRFSVLEGLLFFISLLTLTTWQIKQSRQQEKQVSSIETVPLLNPEMIRAAMVTLFGLGLLIIGSRWFVNSSIEIARWLGLSESIIGLTIVSAGTSMPEVATSVVAAYKKQSDIAVGNVIGSNIFNLLGILGVASIVTPQGLSIAPSMLSFDIPVMTVVSLICLPIFFTGFRINRWEGGLLLGGYAFYVFSLIP